LLRAPNTDFPIYSEDGSGTLPHETAFMLLEQSVFPEDGSEFHSKSHYLPVVVVVPETKRTIVQLFV
jgi:hypothetical protein